MKLVRLTIRSLPGLNRTLELVPDADRACIVLGPNASGKTSLLRALGVLLDPDPGSDPVDIEAEFSDGETTVRGHALGPIRKWQVDGEEAERPDWPGSGPLSAYLVRADALGTAGDPETEFATTLKRAMAGGFDLDALASSTRFAVPPSPRSDARKLAEAERAVEQLEREQARLAADVDTLDDLRLQRDASIEAGNKKVRVDRAIELLQIERSVHALRNAMAAYPEGMDRLDGSEAERLAQFDDDQARMQRELDEQKIERDQAMEASAAIGIDDVDAAATFSAEMAERRQSLQGDERRLVELGERVAANEDDERTAAHRAGGHAEASRPSLEQERLDALERAADRWSAARAECEQLEHSRARHAEQAPDRDALAQTDSAVRSLRAWLRASAPSPMAWTAWSLLLIAAGGTAAWLEWSESLRWPAIAVGCAALLPAVQMILLSIRALNARRHQRHFPAYAMEPPKRWRLEDVARRLDGLERDLAVLHRQRADAERARDIGLDINAARERVAAARRHVDAAADAAGLNAGTVLDTGGRLRLQALSDWRAAGDRLHAARREAAARQRAISEHQQVIQSRFERAGHAPLPEWTAEALGSWLVRFDQRIDKARGARDRARAADKAIDRIEHALRDLATRRRKLLKRAGADDADALNDKVRRFADYRKQADELRGLEHACRTHQQELAAYPDLLELVEAQDDIALSQLRDELDARAEQRDELGERIATIDNERKTAIRERRLEALNADCERLRSRLADARRERVRAEAAQLLIERAREGHGREHQPDLLRRASTLFGRMTHSRFALRFDGRTFGADDARTGLRLGLDQLSTATRIQLLLALRLAWIERNEHGGPDLPLFLDEVLATTDPDRYRAVVEAVQEMVREGRQVLYLSSQPADAEAWRRFAGEPAPQVIELAPMQGESFDFAVAAERRLPDPDLDPAEWARQAGVQPIEAWADPVGVPLFHLLRDRLDLVVRLADRRIETLGECEHARSLDLDLGIDDADGALIDRRIEAARAWVRHWRRSHAAPVRDRDLQESEAITPTFYEAVSELNRDLAGDAAALVEALRDGRVKRFQTAKIEQLEDYLTSTGHLAPARDIPAAERITTLTDSADLANDEARRLDAWLLAGVRGSGRDRGNDR